MTPAGVHVPVVMTHKLIGQLVAAQRSTVSAALAHLASTGALTRQSDGSWLLALGSRGGLAGHRQRHGGGRASDVGEGRFRKN